MAETDSYLNEKNLIDLKKLLASEQLKYEALDYCLEDSDKKRFSIKFMKSFFTNLNTKLDIYSYNNLSVNDYLNELFYTAKDITPAELIGKITFDEVTTKFKPKDKLNDDETKIYNNFAENINYCNHLAQQIFSAVLYKQMGKLEEFSRSIIISANTKKSIDLNQNETYTNKHLFIDAEIDKKRFSELSENEGMKDYNQYFSAKIISSKILGMKLFSNDFEFKNHITFKFSEIESFNKISNHLGLKEQVNRKISDLEHMFIDFNGTNGLRFINSFNDFFQSSFKKLNLEEIGVNVNEGKRGNYR